MKPAIRTYLFSVLIIGSISSCQKTIEEKKLVLPEETAFCKGNNHIRYGKMKDCEGNEYKTVKIGDQVWMAENLRTTRYRNGKKIPQVKENIAWSALTTGAWCFYNNDPKNGRIYGRLYNWFAVHDVSGLAPAGWHVPSLLEWNTLMNTLGGEWNYATNGTAIAGGKLKSTGTIESCTGLWLAPNTDATNSSGFTGLPGGSRYYDYFYGTSNFSGLGAYGTWWCSDQVLEEDAAEATLVYHNDNVYTEYYSQKSGYSVRCIKD